MENKGIDKNVKAFYENNDVVSLETCIRELRTCYIDLIADGKPNVLIYSVFNAKQQNKEKQDLATYYKVVFEEIMSLYSRLYKQKENGGRSFDKNDLVIATTLKDAFINSLILSQTKDENATKINPKSNLFVDKKDLTLERLATQKDFVGIASVKSMFNSLYLEYGQALADLTILRIIGQALKIELINPDEIIDYWNCATYEDLTSIIDKTLETLEKTYKDDNKYKKSDFYIDLMTTKAINYKISILLDTDTNNEEYNKVSRDIERIILKQEKDDANDLKKEQYIRIERKNYSLQPYELTTKIRRYLAVYYWNRIKKEIRGVAESEGSYDKK